MFKTSEMRNSYNLFHRLGLNPTAVTQNTKATAATTTAESTTATTATATTATTTAATARATATPAVPAAVPSAAAANDPKVKLAEELKRMGFAQASVDEAVKHCATADEAVDWLLVHAEAR
eukprot:TRINITY_DN14766_c0_g1_i2.p2 TRINITY_DN14766_c0_g1~~TRINITY_DN14766_c0_g1_i2.p2  ORF type:complete len:121 (-),score=45.54 TRINITY_DN14766_c0_g1_i2:867-1229(-)